MTATAEERLDRLDEIIKAGCPPYTGAVPTFRCGHPRTSENTYTSNKRCITCARARARDSATKRVYVPLGCLSCGGPLGQGHGISGYHPGACEPTTCTCPDGGHPDGLGECGTCRRLVLSHSWHNGRPGSPLPPTTGGIEL